MARPQGLANHLGDLTRVALGGTTATGRLVTVINFNTTAVGNVGAGSDELMTYSLPAEALNVDGKAIIVYVWGATAANGNTKRFDIEIGGGNAALFSTGSNNESFFGGAIIIRSGSDTQEIIQWGGLGNATGSVQRNATTIDDGAAIQINGQAVTATATNDIIQEAMLILAVN